MFTYLFRLVFRLALRLGAVLLAVAPLCLLSTPREVQSAEAEIPLWPDVVDTLEVTSARDTVGERLDLEPGFSSLIPLGPEVSGSRDLSDLVDRLAGVHVHKYGGLGSFSAASVRGSSAAQVRVVLDGVPLASARDGVSNLGLIPLNLLDYAIVHRGAQTLSLTGPPAAGVIELRTPTAASTAPVVGISVGSHETQSMRGVWGHTYRSWSLLVAGQRRSSEGNFAYVDRNGTPNNPEDDHTVRRRNNDHLDESWLWKSALNPFRWTTLAYTGQRNARDGGVPGTESLQTTTTRYHVERVRHQVRAEWRPAFPGASAPWGRATLYATRFWDSTNDRFSNPNGEVGLSRVDEEGAIQADGDEVGLELPIAPWGLRLRAIRASGTESWTPFDRLHDSKGFSRDRENLSTSVSGLWRAPGHRLTLEAGYRWDRATDNYGGPVVFGRPPEPSEPRTSRFEAPTLGARLSLGAGLFLRGNRGRFLRQPTFSELFGENGVQDGNRALRPESGLEWDAGLGLRRSRLQIDLAYFESVTGDEILLLQNSQRTVKAQNVDRTWVRGIESSMFVAYPLSSGFEAELEAQTTWQEAFDRGPSRTYRGNALPYLPKLETYAALRLRGTHWEADYGLSARSRVYRDRYNTTEKRAPAQVLHDLGVEHDLTRWSTLRLEIQNLWNLRTADIEGYPLPGRTTFLEFVFHPVGDPEDGAE